MEAVSAVTHPNNPQEINSRMDRQSKDSFGAAPLCRHAAQPDIVLSEERDSYYAHTLLAENTSELMVTLLGSMRAVILAPELRALASCLYFGLTNLAGKQTLGQEYCDIGLSKGGHASVPPSPGSSLRLYTLLRVLVPYFQERLREGWHGLHSLRDPLGRRARARASMAPPSGIAPTIDDSHDRPSPRVTETGADVRDDHRRGWSKAIIVFFRRVLSWVRRHRPAISGLFEWALRVHLAAFYFDGRYANLAMRVVGARFAYTRAQDEPRARYAILGVFLLLQAAGEAASACAAAAAARSERLPPGLEGGGDNAADKEEKSASSRVPAVMPETTPADAALFPCSRRRCSLCMSPRQNAAATPCGHIFCWECIVGWCQTNPECPLCRQTVLPQSIVCLYQYA